MVAFDFLAFGIIAPVLPDLIRQFEGGDFGRASAITGYLLFAWNAMQFLFSPILGAWSDRFGRRPIILLSCFGLGIDYIVMALAPTLSWLFVGRIISGITASNISTAFAYVTDVTPPEKRAKPFGYVSAALGLGFVIGPAVGGYLGNFHIRAPFWVAAGLSLFNSAGVVAAGTASQIGLAYGQSAAVADPASLARATRWFIGCCYALLLGTHLPSLDVGAVHHEAL